ncbi:nuclear valosin-containing protein-like [Anthonomus grandis grandis]|uniref:nuclear valosin-containing protein-like n=1 Tax=Anthonomus grandis grandis TaxID=2921223 RepID=UPI002166858F|nr:nuclear valosin-containing protein-like [Anthonomus grandis grandis]
MPYMSDPTIVPRVQKYLESNVHKNYVDIHQMADELQKQYRDYAKRKRSAFRASVKKAYSIVLQNYGLEDKESSDEELVSDESDGDNDEGKIDDNSMNNTLMNMYQRQAAIKPNIDDNELIDISSEDSEEEAAYNNYKKSNGEPSTSYAGVQTFANDKASILQRQLADPPPVERPKKRKLEATISPIKNSGGGNKKKKTLNNSSVASPITFKDVGGMDKTLEDVCKLLLHIKHPELYLKLGISPPRGFLLHGPPGCGKTLLANAIAGELGVQLIKVAAPELVAGVSGESEERIRELFERACNAAPCILFIDEIDAITPNRQNAQKEMERRIVAQILSCLDDLCDSENGDKVLVIGATNRPDSIDPALRRAGRFDREICLGIPDLKAREAILRVLTANLTLAPNFDYEAIAKNSPGYVGADLLSLTREAAMAAVSRAYNKIKEERRIEQVLAAERVAEEQKKREEVAKKRAEEAAKKQREAEEVAVASISKKEEEEIVVDDDVNKPETKDPQGGDAVVVLDDTEEPQENLSDGKSDEKAGKEPSETANGVATAVEPDIIVEEESLPVQEPMPVDDVKTLTDLEELQLWLHDRSPINDEQLKSLCITMEDFALALKKVQPSAKREGFATVPDTTWDDVGSLRDIREELQMAILAPVRHSEQFEALGLHVPTGVLLCGPPGCGKTLLAKAIANEAGINFISVKGPELINMYVGESERAVRVCFERARNSAPCVIFFDELDALCPQRSDSRDGGGTMRLVNQMLTEMDGIEGRKGVFLLAASNRPDIIDPAVLRPGRLDKILYVGLPSREDRVDILRAITKNGTQPKLDEDVDLVSLGTSEQTNGYTGADLAALVREASVLALKEYMMAGDSGNALMVSSRHFVKAVEKLRPSVSEKDQKHYDKLRRLYAAVPEQEVEQMEYS